MTVLRMLSVWVRCLLINLVNTSRSVQSSSSIEIWAGGGFILM